MKFTITLFLSSLISISYSRMQDSIPKPEFKPSGKLWGTVFGDYYYKIEADPLKRGNVQYSYLNKGYNAFDVRRVYLGYDYHLTEKLDADFLLSHEGNLDLSGNRTVFVKGANLRYKNILPKTDLVIGQMPTPTWSLLTEKIWGYRSAEKTISDMRKAGSSNDLGIAFQGVIYSKTDAGADKPETIIGYNLLAGNGNAAKPEMDMFKKFYGGIYGKFFNQKLIVDLYSDFERKRLALYREEVLTYKILVAWQSKLFTIGTEEFYQLKDLIYYGDDNDVASVGVSLFGRGVIIKEKLNFFMRADNYFPDLRITAKTILQTELFYLAGLDYSPNKNLHIIPNLWINSYNTHNPTWPESKRKGNDIVSRVTVHYTLK